MERVITVRFWYAKTFEGTEAELNLLEVNEAIKVEYVGYSGDNKNIQSFWVEW